MKLTLTTAQAKSILRNLPANDPNVRLMTDYSGKFMFGAKCIAFGASSALDVSTAVMLTALDGDWFEASQYLMSLARQDDLGLGVVVYFPGIKIAD